MAAQKHKKNCQQKLCSIFECFYPKTLLIQSLNSLDSSRPYGIKKQGALRNCLPKNDFQKSSTKLFQKNIQIVKDWKPTEDTKFTLFEFLCTCPSTFELNTV